ncbi:hypothetical protein KC853_01965 [Candidatus Saccharibacteria bacterium]|nr:hypothetical protein [Candidatus Saccharibacteria bacterium]MCB9834981.1 hypothetical protein [Candidatus Nomurabacteria bacterium]
MIDNDLLSYKLEKLQTELEKSSLFEGYQIYLENNHKIRVGFDQDYFADLYDPIKHSQIMRVEIRLKLTDQRQAKLEFGYLPDITELENRAKQLAYTSKTPIVFASSKLEKYVKLFDKSQLEAWGQDFATRIEEVARISSLTKSFSQTNYGLRQVDFSSYRLVNSDGVDWHDRYSHESILVDLDSRVGFSQRSLRPIDISSTIKRLEYYGRLSQGYQAKSLYHQDSAVKNSRVVLLPGCWEELLDQLLLANLIGTSIEAGQSRFGFEDFGKKLVAHPGFDLKIDQLVDYDYRSYNFGSGGITGKKLDLVKDGRLVTPILDLKLSQKYHYPATHLESLGDCLPSSLIKWQELLSSKESILIIPSLLGIHTAQAITGDYSLPAPHAILFDGQKYRPVENLILNSNTFSDLMNPSTNFCQLPTGEVGLSL